MFTQRTALRTALATFATCALGLTGGAIAHATPASSVAGSAFTAASPAPFYNYAVIVKQGDTVALAAAKAAVPYAGGTVLRAYSEVGVVFAQSNNPKFETLLRGNANVQMVGPTRTAAVVGAEIVAAPADLDASGNVTKPSPALSVSGDSRASGSAAATTSSVDGVPEWDMVAIGADKAHPINSGSSAVTVAVIDSGVDATSPNLTGRIDATRSVGCQSNGIPNTAPAAWAPTTLPNSTTIAAGADHGTHVAGTIGAALTSANTGISGLAPKTSMIAINAMNSGGFFYPEYVTCAFDWAIKHNVQVTNNSYYVDPWEYWCGDQANQAAGLESVRRIVALSQTRGVMNIAAAGNSAQNLDKKTTESGSPNDVDGTAIANRNVANCTSLPADLPGVVSVSAVGQSDTAPNDYSKLQLAWFSNFGSRVDVTAPGVRILSTTVNRNLTYKSGTSMASPHVAGVAALLTAVHPNATPAEKAALLRKQATPMKCPSGDSLCVTTPNGTNYFGAGLVNAYAAVTQDLPAPVAPPVTTQPATKVYSVPTGPNLYVLSGSGASTRARVITFQEWLALGAPKPTPAPVQYVKYSWADPVYMVNAWNAAPASWTWTHLNGAQYKQAGYPRVATTGWIPGTTLTKFGTSTELFASLAGFTHKLTFPEWQATNYAAFTNLSNAGFIKLAWADNVYRMNDLASGRGARIDFATWAAAAAPTPAVVQRDASGVYAKSRTSSDIYYISTGLGIDQKLTFAQWVAAGGPQPTATVAR